MDSRQGAGNRSLVVGASLATAVLLAVVAALHSASTSQTSSPSASEARAEVQTLPNRTKPEATTTATLSPAGADPQETRSVAGKETDTAVNKDQAAVAGAVAHGRRIRGRVVFEDSKKPCPGAHVRLSPKDAEDDEDSPDARATDSDSTGAFAFESIPPGSYKVRASVGSRLRVDGAVSVMENGTQEDLELRLPTPAYIHGRLLAGNGAVFDGLRISARPIGDEDESVDNAAASAIHQDSAGVVAPDGTFRDGPVPAGECRILLCVPSVTNPSGHGSSLIMSGEPLNLGTVTLPANTDTYREFDIRDIFPGHVRVQGAVNGAPADGALITIEDAKTHDFVGAVMLNASGIGESASMQAGTYRVVASAADMSWVYLLPGAHVLKPGETAEFEFDVHLLPGVLRILDAKTGQVLSNERIQLSIDDEPEHGQSIVATTDQSGAARLSLPKGRYRVRAGDPSAQTGTSPIVTVDWGDSGPTPPEVSVHRPW